MGWLLGCLRSSLSENYQWGFPSALCRSVVPLVGISGEVAADFSSWVTWWEPLIENCPCLQKREFESRGKKSQSEGLLRLSAKVRSLAVFRRPGLHCIGFLYYSLTPDYWEASSLLTRHVLCWALLFCQQQSTVLWDLHSFSSQWISDRAVLTFYTQGCMSCTRESIQSQRRPHFIFCFRAGRVIPTESSYCKRHHQLVELIDL